MDLLLSYAPDGCVDSFLSLVGPLALSGVGLGLLGWFFGGLWSAVVSIFDL